MEEFMRELLTREKTAEPAEVPAVVYTVADENRSRAEKPYNPYERLFLWFRTHPLMTAAIVCVLCMSVSITGTLTLWSYAVIPAAVFAVGMLTGLYFVKQHTDGSVRNAFLFTLFSILAAAAYVIALKMGVSAPYVLLNGGLCFLLCLSVLLYVTGRLTYKAGVVLVLAAGFLLRLAYVTALPMTNVQHDAAEMGSGIGHVGYIEYFIHNWHLPDFDVRTVYQFYHNPLHHIIAAVWVCMQTMFGMKYADAMENIQTLTLFYSAACMILSCRIFYRLGLRKRGLLSAAAAVAFCPVFVVMSGSINNDILSIAFLLGAVLHTLHWYEERSVGRIVYIALCVGLGMMTKLSVWLVAPAIAFVFLCAFVMDIRHFKKYLGQFALFLLICAPLALWWSVRNYTEYGVPFGYVMRLSEESGQYIGDVPLRTRLFDFSAFQFQELSPQFTLYSDSYNEYNPLIALFKTAAFDEVISKYYCDNELYNQSLFWSQAVLGITGFGAMIWLSFCRLKEIDTIRKQFLLILYLTIFGSYYAFCFAYPQVCTQNIRYAVPLMVIGAYYIGLAVQRLGDRKNPVVKKVLSWVPCIMTAVFCISSWLVYHYTAVHVEL